MIPQTNHTPYVQSLYRSKQNQRKPEIILTSFVFDSRKFLFPNTPAFHQNTPALRTKPACLKIKRQLSPYLNIGKATTA